MLSDDLTRMAREAGLHLPYWDDDQDPQSNPPAGWAMVSPIGPPLERFSRAVERAAYERAAQIVEPKSPRPCDCAVCDCGNSGDLSAVIQWDAATMLADAIRALGRQHE